jgi:hydrogenase small subunit
MKTMLWLQTGACSGETMALLCAQNPTIEQLVRDGSLRLLWHPSLSGPGASLAEVLEGVESGRQPLDILCVEGSIVTGPHGTGMFDSFRKRPKMDIVRALVGRADHVVAMGTCAAFGGIPAMGNNPTDSIGLQFDRDVAGGLLPADWRAAGGLPVINVAGCPAHPETIVRTLAVLARDLPLELDSLNRPAEFFRSMVHQGCTRNEYHEYDVEDTELGGRACLYFNLGCKGPHTQAVCNTSLWNGRSSKTRAGVPCFGCTSPDFPGENPLFSTRKIADVPVTMPLGVARAQYMAYKNLAKAAAPERVKSKQMEP